MSVRIIEADKSIIWAADVMPAQYETVLRELGGVGLGAVKIGFKVGLGMSLPRAVEVSREIDATLPIIYDHQKAGNDIPDTGKDFAEIMKFSGVDAAILFPFTGDDVQASWVPELQERGIDVIVGAEMTHAGITKRIRERAFAEIFEQAFSQDVRDFVVPGTKPESIEQWRTMMDFELGEGEYTLYAPGFGEQGGRIREAAAIAGPKFHPIPGRAIHDAVNPAAAVRSMMSELTMAGDA